MEIAKALRLVMRELRRAAREARERKVVDEGSIRKLIAANSQVY